MEDYKSKNILIVGLGITGLSCVNFFISKEANVKVMDTRFYSRKIFGILRRDIEYYFGGLNKRWLLDADLIIVSPGLSLYYLNFVYFFARKAEVVGDIEIFMREVDVPVVLVTGSNGKSTVVSMLGLVAKYAGFYVGVGGNFGVPVLDMLNNLYQLYILELSSFQLETVRSLKSVSSTVLNISEDHLDRYPLGKMLEYKKNKLRVYENSSICIVNAEDANTFPKYAKKCISFGVNVGDYRLKKIFNNIWLTKRGFSILNCSKMLINGVHNYVNSLAVLALSESLGISMDVCVYGLKNFVGLNHRFEIISTRDNIIWINDSKSTNIGSVSAAVSNLGVEKKIHLLLGGNSKGMDFKKLKIFLSKYRRVFIYCFGRDGRFICSLFPQNSILVNTLKEVMYIIGNNVKSGDLVLFSPACSSLDQFRSYKERGNLFKKIVKEINNDYVFY